LLVRTEIQRRINSPSSQKRSKLTKINLDLSLDLPNITGISDISYTLYINTSLNQFTIYEFANYLYQRLSVQLLRSIATLSTTLDAIRYRISTMAGIKSLSKTLYLGTFVHCVSLKKLDFLSAVFVDEHGKIVATNHDKSEESYQVTFSELGWKEKDVTILRTKGEKFFFPGFIGTSLSRVYLYFKS
jgi:hypothetical protein